MQFAVLQCDVQYVPPAATLCSHVQRPALAQENRQAARDVYQSGGGKGSVTQLPGQKQQQHSCSTLRKGSALAQRLSNATPGWTKAAVAALSMTHPCWRAACRQGATHGTGHSPLPQPHRCCAAELGAVASSQALGVRASASVQASFRLLSSCTAAIRTGQEFHWMHHLGQARRSQKSLSCTEC